MCLAEALLRIPDAETADLLIRDKILAASWEGHLGTSDSLFVNASTWALMLTGRVIEMDASAESQDNAAGFMGLLKQLVTRSGESLIRQALVTAMRILGRQFVMGRTIGDALQRAKEYEARGYCYSYDMLGEAAYTAADAERYFNAYSAAIAAIGEASQGMGTVEGRAFPSSYRRFIHATSLRNAIVSCVSWCPGLGFWWNRPGTPTSG